MGDPIEINMLVSSESVKLAIVVPIYNTERYLDIFLQSLKKQTFKNYHIYAVNDGSTDQSLNILKEWKKKEDRLIIINKENKGVSSARNSALCEIENSGKSYEYIYFCDSDDFLETDTLEKVITAMEYLKADYGLFSVKKIYKNKTVCTKQGITDIKTLTQKEILKQYFRFGLNWRKEPCSEAFLNNKIFRFRFIKKEKFDERLKRSEDFHFFIRIYKHIKKGVLVPNAWFYYRMRRSSLTHSLKMTGDLIACDDLYKRNECRSILEKMLIQHKLWRAAYLEIFNGDKTKEDVVPYIYGKKIYPPAFLSDIKLFVTLFVIPSSVINLLRFIRGKFKLSELDKYNMFE